MSRSPSDEDFPYFLAINCNVSVNDYILIRRQ